MVADGRIKDETGMALYIIEEMGDDISSVTDKTNPATQFMRDDDGGAQTYTPKQEAGIERVMADNKISREEAIRALNESGQLK